jgi:hypothetical protein
VSFAAITLCVASRRIIPKANVYFVMIQTGNVWIHPRTTCLDMSTLRIRGAIPPLPQYVFMAWCLVKHRHSLIFYLLTISLPIPKQNVATYHPPTISNVRQGSLRCVQNQVIRISQNISSGHEKDDDKQTVRHNSRHGPISPHANEEMYKSCTYSAASWA